MITLYHKEKAKYVCLWVTVHIIQTIKSTKFHSYEISIDSSIAHVTSAHTELPVFLAQYSFV